MLTIYQYITAIVKRPSCCIMMVSQYAMEEGNQTVHKTWLWGETVVVSKLLSVNVMIVLVELLYLVM